MNDSKEIQRFRANPVEIVIFLIVAGVFCHSIYGLFYDSHGFTPAALKPMAANPISEAPRTPASASQAFLNLEIKCAQSHDQDTTAGKVRLAGPLCGTDGSTPATQLTKTSVMNAANQFSATVFTDVNSAKFSTDYIPLTTGKNVLHLEFTYRNGKAVTQDLTISRY
jgi:hypothetical protein